MVEIVFVSSGCPLVRPVTTCVPDLVRMQVVRVGGANFTDLTSSTLFPAVVLSLDDLRDVFSSSLALALARSVTNFSANTKIEC